MDNTTADPDVEDLNLHLSPLDDHLLSTTISHLPNLKTLSISECNCLRVAVLRHPSLSFLFISYCADLYMLDLHLPSLTTLKLHSLPKLSTRPSTLISRASSLQNLSFSNCPSAIVPSSPSSPKSSMSASMRSLPLFHRCCSNADNEFSQILSNYPNMKSLEVSHCHVMEKLKIPSNSSLKALTITGCSRLTNVSVFQSGQFLRLLDLSSSLSITDEGLGFLYALPSLYEVRLSNCPNLNHPNIELPNLKRLDLSFSNINGLGGDLPELRVLLMASFQGSSSCLASALTICPKIKYLDVSLSKFSNICLNLPNLEVLVASGCFNLELIEFFTKSPHLDLIDIAGSTLIKLEDLLLPLKNDLFLPKVVHATLPKKFSVLDIDITDPYMIPPLKFNELEQKFAQVLFVWWGNGHLHQEKGAPQREVWHETHYLSSRGKVLPFEIL
ncbi:hypothetical protein P9112_005627 [Eukaryota sp. TZLM1-RC]